MSESSKTKALREFALTRSCNAAIAANENSRPMAQAALLINGAAASAIIAFFTKDKIDTALLTAIPWSLGFYAIGVICGAVTLYFMTECLDMWNCFWELIAQGASQNEISDERSKAEAWWTYVTISFFISVACFVIGSGAFAWGILRIVPAAAAAPVCVSSFPYAPHRYVHPFWEDCAFGCKSLAAPFEVLPKRLDG